MDHDLTEFSRSQAGEDLFLATLFDLRHGGVFVEAGALDGERLSNTWLFEKKLGWTGVLVEPIPQLAESCRANRPRSAVVQAALGSKSGNVELTVPRESPEFATTLGPEHLSLRHTGSEVDHIVVPQSTLTQVLHNQGLTHIDLLVLDVEDAEVAVLSGFDLKGFAPEVIMIERQALKLGVVVPLLTAGYSFHARVGENDVWRKASVASGMKRFPALLRIAIGPTARAWVRRGLQRLRLLDAVRRVRASRHSL